MSDARQLALLLVGAAALAVVGIVAATAFPEPCEEFEGIGQLELAFVAAADALAVTREEGATLELVGERLDIGTWRGAVALPPGARVLGSDFGFFAVTDSDLVALRPGSGLASAPRDVEGYEVVGVGTTSAGLIDDDGAIAVISSDYERERCGTLPPDADVLAIDRGLAIIAAPGGIAVRTLSGNEIGTVPFDVPVLDATIDDDDAIVVTEDEVVRIGLRGPERGAVAESGPLDEVLAAQADRVLARSEGDETDVVGVSLGAVQDDLDVMRLSVDGAVVDAVATPAGTVVLTDTGLQTDRERSVVLTSEITASSLVASEDGQVGLVVEGDGGPVLLVWGRDIDV